MRNEIQTAFGLDTMEEAFGTGEKIISLYGKKHDVVLYIEKARKMVCLRLWAQVRSYLSCMSTQWVDEVRLAGESTNLYEDAVREATHVAASTTT
jgi:hypothetical protein